MMTASPAPLFDRPCRPRLRCGGAQNGAFRACASPTECSTLGPMRTAKEDITLIGEGGWWKGERDPLMNAVILLCMYAKARHKPVRNLHKLADAVEKGDNQAAEKHYGRLAQEVATTLRKYPDIVGTLNTMSEMTEEGMAHIDRLTVMCM